MKENNLKAKYIKPYIQTTISHDFSDKLKNLLNIIILRSQMELGVQILLIYGHMMMDLYI